MKRLVGMVLSLGLVVVLSGCGSSTKETVSSPAIGQLASCLTENGATFYGTEWCPHCKEQKRLFGDALAQVNYVDCDKNSPACASAGVKGYPTWVFADGSQLVGTQSLEALAAKSNCTFAPEALAAEQQESVTGGQQ